MRETVRDMTVERVYLVGFMGAGKTSVGRALATQLGWSFVDLDAEIERSQKMQVRDIFSKSGEAHFRQLEREHLKRASERPRAVIALGGGATIDPENRLVIDSTGTSVWLNVPFDTAARRVSMDGSRPLFKDLQHAERLYETRLPIYKLARIHVLADNRPPVEIAGEVAMRLQDI
ncbi:MAG TPA: shikimate kinase [Terriglobia bacterium]|nr:shikimate kinase [Terriglobia bacterium]